MLLWLNPLCAYKRLEQSLKFTYQFVGTKVKIKEDCYEVIVISVDIYAAQRAEKLDLSKHNYGSKL